MGPGEIALDRDGGTAVIAFQGEHDLNTAPELRSRLAAAIAEGLPVVVDLSGAAFVDSSVLGAVLDARRDAHERGVGFAVALAGGARPVERVLDVTGLHSTLPVHRSRAAAVQEARAGASGG